MGLFDYVDFEIKCPLCGSMVNDFQSKDGACFLDRVQPHDVRNFYSSCYNCKAWVECEYTPPAGVGTIEAVFCKELAPPHEAKPEDFITVKINWDSNANKKDNNKELPGT